MLSIISTIVFADTKTLSSITKNITVQAGESITLDPRSDVGCTKVNGWAGCAIATSYTTSDDNAFSITYEQTSVNFSPYKLNGNGSSTGYYRIYNLTANKRGNYTFTCKVTYLKERVYKTKELLNGSHYWGISGVVSATYNITVIDVTSISIPNTLTKTIGDAYTFSPVITDNGATTKLTWQSSNTSVVTVNSSGVMSAVGVGTATIYCTASNGVSARCVVTVNPVLATSIALNMSTAELTIGESLKLIAKVSPDNVTNKNVTWSSTNTAVATVDGKGNVTATGKGQCSIIATSADGSSKTETCQIIVPSNVLYANDTKGVPGGMLTLPILLKNESSITGLQFELQLPNGIRVAADNYGKLAVNMSDRTQDQSISGSVLSNGNSQFVIFSATSSPLKGHDGTIAYVTLNIGEEMVVGEYEISINNVELTTTGGELLYHKNLMSKLTLTEAIMGDVNGDGNITVTDAVGIVNHVLHRTPSVFIGKTADVNGDGNISVSDAVSIVNIVLNK